MTVQRIATRFSIVVSLLAVSVAVVSAQTGDVRWGSPIRPAPRVDMDVLAPELSKPDLRTTAPPAGATSGVIGIPTDETNYSSLQVPEDIMRADVDRFGSEGAYDFSDDMPTQRKINCPDSAGFKSIRDISFDIRPSMTGDMGNPIPVPQECPLITAPYTGRHFSQTCFQWKAAALCTKASYFEDVQLERYGHTLCPVFQPVISGTLFFLTVPMLPYKMGLVPPNECVYTLGHHRVGSCAPHQLDPFPISIRAILFEGAAIGGAVALVP